MASGLLLVIGGGVSVVGAAVFGFGSSTVGSWITIAAAAIYSVGFLVFGLGFVQPTALAARGLLIATGTVGLVSVLIGLLPVNSAVLDVLLLVAELLVAVLLLIGAILVMVRSGVRPPISWAILPAGIWETVSMLLILARIGGEWWTLVLFGLLCVIAGVAIRVGTLRLSPATAAEIGTAAS